MLNDALSSIGGIDSTKKTKSAENSPEAIQERFMSLLVAQLKNQDPLQPMDNAAVTSQMAQLNTVTGINKLNESMQDMTKSVSGSQSIQATTMLGRTVMLEGNNLSLSGGNAKAAIELKQTADVVNINILSSAGDVLQTIDLGPLGKGVHEFSWDGMNVNGGISQNGNYQYEIIAKAAGQDAEVVPLTQTQVQGVRNSPTGAMLLTENGSEVSLGDIKQIF